MNFLRNNIYYPIIIFYERVCRFFYWGWKLKDSHDWDYYYLNQIIHFKLVRMKKRLIDDAKAGKLAVYCEWQVKEKDRAHRMLLTSVELSRRLMNEDEYLWDQYVAGKISATTYFKKNEAKQARDRKYFYEILEKWGRYWWE